MLANQSLTSGGTYVDENGSIVHSANLPLTSNVVGPYGRSRTNATRKLPRKYGDLD